MTSDECLKNGNFTIKPINKSPAVKYLFGEKSEYLSQSKIFLVREDSLSYHLNLFETENSKFDIKVVKFGEKYIVCDGMHRSSVLYFKGVRNMDVNLVSIETEPIFANFEPYIESKYFED